MPATPTSGLDKLSEIKDLIDQLSVVEGKLYENERQIFTELRQKHAETSTIGFDDKILLEVMLRNINIRRDAGMI